MDHLEGTFQGFGGLELYYQRWRPKGEPKAVLAIVHGFGEHSGRYDNVVNWLVPKGYAIYAFDLRDTGGRRDSAVTSTAGRSTGRTCGPF